MVARLGELPFARNRPSSEATWTPGIAATFCEQRASTGHARSEKAAASRAAKGSRRVIGASTRHDAFGLQCFASIMPGGKVRECRRFRFRPPPWLFWLVHAVRDAPP